MNELVYPSEPVLAERATPPNDLVYPRERTLGKITLVLGLIGWTALIAGTAGMALLGLGVGYVLSLFLHSTLIAHLKGNGVELSKEQFPDLYEQFMACCKRLQVEPPRAFILNGNGGLNAFATKFLGAQYVVLLADVVDAMSEHPDGVRFYLGHELGHLRMKHLRGRLLRWPVLWLPVLGAAYSRARESTCDRHGLACSSSPEGAARALAALSAGTQRWKTLSLPAYLEQMKQSSEFWMSFHELTGGYPWLTKRIARVLDPQAVMPRRSRAAHFVAACVPYTGPLGGGFSILIMVYMAVVLSSIALPLYQTMLAKNTLQTAAQQTQPILDGLAAYYEAHDEAPDSLGSAGLPEQIAGATLLYRADRMQVDVSSKSGTLSYVPEADDDRHVTWFCSVTGAPAKTDLPAGCVAAPTP